MALCCRQPARRGGAGLQLADVLRAALPAAAAASYRLPAHHWKTIRALLCCHSPELGGHLYRCQDCGKDHFIAHSCRNRHCPSCQKTQAFEWLQKQSASLLPVPYFHVVFTLPHALNGLIAQNRRALYKLLFKSASATLIEFAHHKLQAQIGVTAVLHTWSQTLLDHYHLHCIVSAGGLRLGGKGWRSAGATYLFAVKALSKVFRGKFLDGLRGLHGSGSLAFHGKLALLADKREFDNLLASACAKPWVVYSKKPFAGPRAVLAYLSRYTHRVAIGNGRIRKLDAEANAVTFSYKDYADKARTKMMTLPLIEFLRRFCLHILPQRFVKIRHYGLLGNRNRSEKIALARAELGSAQESCHALACQENLLPPAPLLICPHCGSSKLLFIQRREPLRRLLSPPDTS
jgi:hypothetical protein